MKPIIALLCLALMGGCASADKVAGLPDCRDVTLSNHTHKAPHRAPACSFSVGGFAVFD